jgi:predicted double-glycine peptidase
MAKEYYIWHTKNPITMAKRFTVPLIAQDTDNTCWHASAMMIWQYFQGQTGRQGPMNTLALAYDVNRVIYPFDFTRLAEKVGMRPVPGPIGSVTATNIESWLTMYGPLWCAGHWYEDRGHVIVLTGVDDNNVYLNDPDGGVPKQGSIAWFNLKLFKNALGSVMYKDPSAY